MVVSKDQLLEVHKEYLLQIFGGFHPPTVYLLKRLIFRYFIFNFPFYGEYSNFE